MTTPERFRRRQRREFAALVVLAILMVAQGLYFNIQDRNQKQCIADKVDEITSVFKTRAALNDKNTVLVKRDARHTSHIILAVGKIHTEAEFQKIESLYRKQTARIKAQRAAIVASLADHPVPDFPPGQCGVSGPAIQALSALAQAQ